MAEFHRLHVSYKLPPLLSKAIDALEEAVKNEDLIVDCLQDEVRSCARELDNDEREDEIIDYYCRRRWF